MTVLGKSRVRTRLVVPALAALLAATAFDVPSLAGTDSTVAPARGVSAAAASGLATGHHAAGKAARAAFPTLRTHVTMGGLDVPWDVAVLPSGAWLVTERDRQRIIMRTATGHNRVISNGPPGLWSSGETGLMSILADPRVARNGRFYTCNGWQRGSRHDIRVLAWEFYRHHTRARVVNTLLSGIQTTTGRHGGCRLRFGSSGALYVGTGDAAVGTNPQNLRSLNGKLLRMNRYTGNAWRDNPWIHSPNRHKRYIFNYGHRNVQGLALRADGTLWSIEHGTDRDDEINKAVARGNYGWNPVPGYDESTPMTDFSLPGRQIGARWRSGFPTIATSGAVWVRGRQWGRYRGTLAVCALKGSKLLFMRFDRNGRFVWAKTPPAMRGTYGRLRSVVLAPNNDLLVTTANGGGGAGGDRVVRVRPR